jgi:hypothetical protein
MDPTDKYFSYKKKKMDPMDKYLVIAKYLSVVSIGPFFFISF